MKIRYYYGPEYISHVLSMWAEKHRITLLHIQPGRPQQNAYVERYNRTVRYSWLAQYLFDTIEEGVISDFATPPEQGEESVLT